MLSAPGWHAGLAPALLGGGEPASVRSTLVARRFRTLGWATTGGVVAGAALGLLVIVSWDIEPETVSGDAAAADFVAAWDRSLRGTYYVASEFHRTTPNGNLDSVHELARRPPDVVRRQFGGLAGRIGDHPIMCSTDPDEQVSCIRGDVELDPYEESVEDEVARWDDYFDGQVPLYRVETRGDGCFDLTLTQMFPAPPYGRYARFCFDDATGAIVYSEIRKDEGTDVQEAIEVRSAVTDADFALPE